jgi:hypothetical protein
MAEIKHGFILRSGAVIVPDYQLLARDEDTVEAFQSQLTYKEYLNWKKEQLDKVIAEMMQDWSDRDADFDARLKHRIDAKELTERLLNGH